MKVQSVNEVIFLSGLLLVQGSNVLCSPDAATVHNCFWGEQWFDDPDYAKISCFVLISVPDSQLGCSCALGWIHGEGQS